MPESQGWGEGEGQGSGLRELHRQQPVVAGLDSFQLQILFPEVGMTEFPVSNLNLGLKCPAVSGKVEVPCFKDAMQL